MRILPTLSAILLALSLPWLSGCPTAAAQTRVDVDLVDRDSGAVLPEYTHPQGIFVPGEPGRRYSVRLHNRSGERVLVVLSVDGVNAVTGDTADPSQAGYVLGPWETADILGWRKTLDDIAQFYFTALPDSYAARTGRPHNVGVIGIAVFGERPLVHARPDPLPRPPWARPGPYQRQAAEATAPAAADESMADASAARDTGSAERIGTGHGAREWSPTRHTAFVRASRRPMQVTELRYESPQALVAMGILPRWPAYRHGADAPRAFPGSFVPDPPSDW